MAIDYEDFVLRILPDGTDKFRITADSTEGEEQGALGREVVEALESEARTGLGSSASRPIRELDLAAEATIVSPQIGERLFETFFQGAIRQLFATSRTAAQARERGVRVKIRIDPREPRLAGISGLPWETLQDPETGRFLSLDRLNPVVRYLEVSEPNRPVPFRPPLRILVVIANAEATTPLDLDAERKALKNAWRSDNVEISFLERPTLDTLRQHLLSSPQHVFHFMGHGGFDDARGAGHLLFETSSGAPQTVRDEALATVLRGEGRPRLVVLNACQTGRTSDQPGRHPFAGVAPALVRAGVPAVVAMRRGISDPAAIVFSKSLYERLAAGDPVDAAVAEGRIAMHNGDPDSLEWATPMLFMRLPDGHLFAAQKESPAAGTTESSFEVGDIESHEEVLLFGELNQGLGAGRRASVPETLRTQVKAGDIKSGKGVYIGGRINRS
ncbi:MAG: CHAT domain-containing protein [Acidobacteria bacterium]|nr:CHAT domain-containing protein [Acidobacteriota bacterium]